MSKFSFRQCPNPQCRLRFPAPTAVDHNLPCPHCGIATILDIPVIENQLVDPTYQPSPGPQLHLLLDNLRSAFNVGSIMRTADGVGVTHVHLAGISATPDNPKVGKTGLSAEFASPWTYWSNALEAVGSLRASGYQIWALEGGGGAQPITNLLPISSQASIVLIAGNELAGVDPALLSLCDQVVFLPMQGFKRSLNVAVAAGIALYLMRFGK